MSGQSLQSTTELRALEQFDTIPAGHTGLVITSDRFAPHLQPSEIAVIDPADRTPVSGELFAIQYETWRGRMTRVVQTFGRECHDENLEPWIGWFDRFQFVQPGEMVLSDGPMTGEDWSMHRCVGRVVGFVAPEWELASSAGGHRRAERRA